MNKLNIIYIDDEVENLKSFKASFRRDFTIFLCENVSAAHEVLAQEEIQVIVSDHKMPNESGLSFFEKISKTNPEIMRILITAYGDYDLVQDSINKGNVYRFINKPWDHNHLKATIEDAGKIYVLNKKNASLRTSYFQLFEENPNPMLIVDPDDQLIVKSNAAAQHLFANRKEDALNNYSLNELFNADISFSSVSMIDFPFKSQIIRLQFIPKEIRLVDKKQVLLTITDLSEVIKKQREKDRLIADIQQEERNRLAMEIHDGIGQEIVVLKLTAENLLHNCDKADENANELFIDGIQEVLKKVRSLSYHLAPPEIEKGLIYGLQSLVAKLKSVLTIQFEVAIDPVAASHFSALNLTQESVYHIYRVIQEFINNSIQHAKCSRLKIDLSLKENVLALLLEDNGIGFDTSQSLTGLGIQNIEKRLTSNNFNYELKSELGKGTSLLLRFRENLNRALEE